ncbi:hypothetical protein TPHA_0H00470 [Tetrapisispora phaffii CBS 4417]|uniref:PUM-HD domain-containing protein n=1 Tax=Tetrapisispora phaffii (strain ATCC 24235 / CBS 4417 / NBRC 1672 / NRRL Y-8282 / UCD 70-5) TaxID=1071381 RepID=G8BWV3_TETPH|nr:hypothetical protein TPHA_0H00470 [Tetrapisispora phaffii CBS 4417]CCE64257.1 hypothetical protein TPHA_0H00470 [Tetrapisispora phaffii CBS 4417]
MGYNSGQNAEEMRNQFPVLDSQDGVRTGDMIGNSHSNGSSVPFPYNHQSTVSINSIQSIVEPITPPSVVQMDVKKNHHKTRSLDSSNFTPSVNMFDRGADINSIKNSQVGSHFPIYNFDDSINGNSNMIVAPTLSSNTPLPMINEFDTLSNGTINNTQSASYSMGRQMHKQRIPSSNKARQSENSKNFQNQSALSSSLASSSMHTSNQPSSMAELSLLPLDKINYASLATDQFGCRFLQKKLEYPAESNIVRDLLYEDIKSIFLELVLDPFGNYLIQKLCDYFTTDQKTSLIKSIYPHVFQISINQYGTRSLQKIIDTVENDAQIDLIIRGFSRECASINQIVTLINDLNGNHVIQKCIFKFPTTKFDFIVDAIIHKNNIVLISTHKHGCCVLQKLLGISTLQHIFKLSTKIIEYLHFLINDQFGNYIVQFLFDIEELDFYLLSEIYNKLVGDICNLACSKFSSNVIEKFIEKLFRLLIKLITNDKKQNIKPADKDLIQVCIDIILTIVNIFTRNLNGLIKDKFANYTLQTLLDVKNYTPFLMYDGNKQFILQENYQEFGIEFNKRINNLIYLTKNVLPSIKTTSYAKKIKLKVKVFAELKGTAFTDFVQNNDLQKQNSESTEHISQNKKFTKKKLHERYSSLPNIINKTTNPSLQSSISNILANQSHVKPGDAININSRLLSTSNNITYSNPNQTGGSGYNFEENNRPSNLLEIGLKSLTLENQQLQPQPTIVQKRLSIFSTNETALNNGMGHSQVDMSTNSSSYPLPNPLLQSYTSLSISALTDIDDNSMTQSAMNDPFQKDQLLKNQMYP